LPQQSSSLWQSSYSGRQPEGGWQTFTPVGPNGPHDLEQHVLSHETLLEQMVPVGLQPPPLGSDSQRPAVAPVAIAQLPPQHWKSAVQTSYVCPQNDTLEQMPPAVQ
jgi:hypothetical protein